MLMMNSSRLFRVAFVGAAVLTAACGSDSPSGPTTPPASSLDLSAVLSEISRGTPNAARAEMGPSAAPVGSAAVVPSACTYAAASQSFACPTQTVNGLTIMLSYTVLDAAGHPQSAPNVATTAAVRASSTVKGTVTLSSSGATSVSGSITLDRTETMTLSGLLTGVHTLNGTATGTSTAVTTIDGVTLHTSSTDKSTTANVVLPSSGASSAWPLSGSITSDQNLVSSVGNSSVVSSTIHTVMTFNGSANMVVTINIGGKTVTCTLNLQNPAPSTCSS